jgi:hypothetical protein
MLILVLLNTIFKVFDETSEVHGVVMTLKGTISY